MPPSFASVALAWLIEHRLLVPLKERRGCVRSRADRRARRHAQAEAAIPAVGLKPAAGRKGGEFQAAKSETEGGQLGEMCSYIWAALTGPVRQSWDALPEVEGIGVYGATFPPAKGQLRRAKFSDIDRVVGTPIFVRQT
jgi:hypothetical protein